MTSLPGSVREKNRKNPQNPTFLWANWSSRLHLHSYDSWRDRIVEIIDSLVL